MVPKRSQIDNAAKLLSASFKGLLNNDNTSNGLLVLFYVSKEEWYASLSDDSKKDEDVIYFIKHLRNLQQDRVYIINNNDATLSVANN
jgi:uncharacterized membrane protein